jgi:ABC-2 type transport system ATP-binding protein
MIHFEHITFRYRRSLGPVLDGFSWRLPEGRTVLLGPNGAGKTTLLSIAADAMRPDRGRVCLGALDPARLGERAMYRRAVGWMPQQVRPVPGLSVREQVAYAAWLKGLSRSDAWSAAAEALRQVGMSDMHHRKSSTLSGGQLRRVGLAQALAHDAEVLLLDEPTVGLDPAQRARFRQVLAALSPERPVLVSTHQVDDLSELFDTVVVIEEGKIRFEGTAAAFLDLAPASIERRAEVAYAQVVSGEH